MSKEQHSVGNWIIAPALPSVDPLLRQYRSILNHCDVIGLQIYRIRWCQYQSKERRPIRLPMWLINSRLTDILSRTVLKLSFWNLRFRAPLRAYGQRMLFIKAHRKRVVDFLFVLIDLFCYVLRLKQYERK